MGNSLTCTCQHSAATKAAYRFLASDKTDGQTLLQGNTEATGQRIRTSKKETILLLQDTTIFGYPEWCAHVGDRESDIYELYCLASKLKTHFLVRTCVNNLAENTILEKEIKTPDVMEKDTTQIRSSPLFEKGTITLTLLGGYAGNKSKMLPENIIIWRQLRHLIEILAGWKIAAENYG